MKKILLIILITGGVINICAQQELSLSDAIKTGLKNNYDLEMMRNNEEIADINNTWGNTGAMPTIDFSMTGRENYNTNSTEDYRTQNLSPDINLNWLIFNGFSAKINKQRYEELEKQSQGNTAILIESTIQDIIIAYNNCLLQQELIEVFKELSDLSKDRYKRILDSKEIGAGTTYESLQAKTSWLEDQSNYLMQKNTFDNAVRTLNYIMAIDDDKHWEFISELNTETLDYSLEDLMNSLLKNNNTLKNQYIYQSLMAKATALAKSAYYPKLSLNTGVSNTNLSNYYTGTTPDVTQKYTDTYVGLTLSWTIFNGGSRKRSVEIAKISEESAQVEVKQMEHSLKNQLLQLYNNYEVYKAVLTLAEEKEETAKLNMELSAEKLNNGSINSFNYRDIQIVYMNAAIARLQAINDVIQSNTDLLRITGGIIDEYNQTE